MVITRQASNLTAVVPKGIQLLLSIALATFLVAGPAVPAFAGDDPLSEALTGLEDLTTRIDELVELTERLMNDQWGTEVPRTVDIGGINRIEQALAIIRVEATTVLEPLIGTYSADRVLAAITAILFRERMIFPGQGDLIQLLGAWNDYRDAIDDAMAVRDDLRKRTGLPAVTGVRVCPLEEVDTFVSDWGDSRGWRTHKGNDINSPMGTPLVAMESGVVIQADWHYLGGNGIYVRGDITGDVYYYAHLSAYADNITVGTPVAAGQVIGYVGDTGNADVPHLHLGWMPGGGGLDNLQDGYPLLVELCL